jgi:SCY1-like protein 1
MGNCGSTTTGGASGTGLAGVVSKNYAAIAKSSLTIPFYYSNPYALMCCPLSSPLLASAPLPSAPLLSAQVISIYSLDHTGANALSRHRASQGYKRLRSLAHPGVVRGGEGWRGEGKPGDARAEERTGFITGLTVPLSALLQSHSPIFSHPLLQSSFPCLDPDTVPIKAREGYIREGLYCLLQSLAFLHSSPSLSYGNLNPDNIAVSRGGEWKLLFFDCAAVLGGDSRREEREGRSLEDRSGEERLLQCPLPYQSPERVAVGRGGEDERINKGVGVMEGKAADAYAFGMLCLAIFAGLDAVKERGGDRGGALSKLPSDLRPYVTKMLAPAAKARFTDFNSMLRSCEYFSTPVGEALRFVDELAVKEAADKQAFFRKLPDVLPSIPGYIAKYKVLPALMNALEYGAAGGGGTAVLGPILEIASGLPQDEYQRDIIPCVIRLFGNNDRATRVQLLHHLPAYIDKLTPEVVNSSVLPAIVNGFSDTSPILREATVKAALHLAPYVNNDNKYNILFKHLRGMLMDAEASIRVNTIICLGRTAHTIDDQSQRDSMLLPCFMKALQDPFPPARAAALRGVTYCLTPATIRLPEGQTYWSPADIARKVIPAASYSTLDAADDNREAAFACIDACLKVLRNYSTVLSRQSERKAREAETETQTPMPGVDKVAAAPGVAGKAADVMASALGWAVSSLASRIIPSGNIDGTEASLSIPTQGIPQPAAPPAPGARLLKSAPESARVTTFPPTMSKLQSETQSRRAEESGEGWGDDDWSTLDKATAPKQSNKWGWDEGDPITDDLVSTQSTAALSSSSTRVLPTGNGSKSAAAMPVPAPARTHASTPASAPAPAVAASNGWDWDDKETTVKPASKPVAVINSLVKPKPVAAPEAAEAAPKKLVLAKKATSTADSGWDEW